MRIGYIFIYEGQSTNTFSGDKKENSYSNRNGEHRYKVDGEVYLRSIVLKQEGLNAVAIMDILSEDETDIGYFDRNTEYKKSFFKGKGFFSNENFYELIQ
ncbi:MAG: hypothetical protein LBV03_00350 [Fusobacteriales bacterium]|jgi:hypothetical protein|nr:hypothetical protein [Fusobacteriales bacterium]